MHTLCCSKARLPIMNNEKCPSFVSQLIAFHRNRAGNKNKNKDLFDVNAVEP